MLNHRVVEVALNLTLFWRQRPIMQRMTIQDVLHLGPSQNVCIALLENKCTPIIPPRQRDAGGLTYNFFLPFVCFIQAGEIHRWLIVCLETKIVLLNGVPVELRTFELCELSRKTAITLWNACGYHTGIRGGILQFPFCDHQKKWSTDRPYRHASNINLTD